MTRIFWLSRLVLFCMGWMLGTWQGGAACGDFESRRYTVEPARWKTCIVDATPLFRMGACGCVLTEMSARPAVVACPRHAAAVLLAIDCRECWGQFR